MVIDLFKPGAAEIVVRSGALSYGASEEMMMRMRGTDGVVAASAARDSLLRQLYRQLRRPSRELGIRRFAGVERCVSREMTFAIAFSALLRCSFSIKLNAPPSYQLYAHPASS